MIPLAQLVARFLAVVAMWPHDIAGSMFRARAALDREPVPDLGEGEG